MSSRQLILPESVPIDGDDNSNSTAVSPSVGSEAVARADRVVIEPFFHSLQTETRSLKVVLKRQQDNDDTGTPSPLNSPPESFQPTTQVTRDSGGRASLTNGQRPDFQTELGQFLDREGQIRSPDAVEDLLKLCLPLEATFDKEVVILALSKTFVAGVKDRIVNSKPFLQLLRQWLVQAVKEKHDTAVSILRLLRQLPITVEALKVSQLGKVVKALTKSADKNLFQSWMVEVQIASAAKTTPPIPANIVPQQQPTTTKAKNVKMAIDISDMFKEVDSAPRPKKQKTEQSVRNQIFDPVQDLMMQLEKQDVTHKKSPMHSVASPISPPNEEIIIPPTETLKTGKRVHWPPDSRLCSVRYFQSDQNERKHTFKNAKEMDRQEAQAVRKPHRELHAQIDWHLPKAISNITTLPEVISTEADKQRHREKSVLAAIYFDDMSIPSSPADPPASECNGSSSNARHIPLFDVSMQPTAMNVLANPQMITQLLHTLQSNVQPPRQKKKKYPFKCRFFAQGRCTKGSDCQFLHNNS